MMLTSDEMLLFRLHVPCLLADMATGKILYATRALEEVFGVNVVGELANGRTLEDLFPDDVRQQISVARQTPEGGNSPLARLIGPDARPCCKRLSGELFPVALKVSLQIYEKRLCAVVTVIDQTMLALRPPPLPPPVATPVNPSPAKE